MIQRRWTKLFLTTVALCTVVTAATVNNVPADVSDQYSGQFVGSLPVFNPTTGLTNFQSGFTNVGVPTYPMMGTTTTFTDTSQQITTVTTTPVNTTSLSQQIVNNYDTSLQSQQQNLNNPQQVGTYGYTYASSYLGNTTSSFDMFGTSDQGSQFVGAVPTQLYQKVVNITSSNPISTVNPSFGLDPFTTAPEPGTLVLLGLGLLAVIGVRSKRRKLEA